MLSINTNLPSIIAQSSLKNSTLKLNQAVERMSTGFKINHASDNAANYSISTNMTTKIGAYQVAEDNVAMGLDLLSTANGSLDLISDKLSRLRALAEQAGNGTYGNQSLKAINSEANAIVDEIERAYSTTEYNGIKLFGEMKPQFIEEVVERDTSSMTTLASVDENTEISSGTYSISSAEELAKLATMTNNGKVKGGEFILANDIDLMYSTGGDWTPIGNNTNAFNADFDGNGHVIKNLYINGRDKEYQGLFGYTDSGEIKNIGVENVNITGFKSIGGLIGYANNNTAINNSYATGNVTGDEITGGLVGTMENRSAINNSYATGNVTGNKIIGGLVGRMENSSVINNSYATVSVAGNEIIGGLNGWVEAGSQVNNSYATGSVSGNKYSGGLVGMRGTGGSINNSYYNRETTGQNDTGNGVGVSTSELQELIANGTLKEAKHDENHQIITFQVGISASNSSQISLDTKFNLNVSPLRAIGVGKADYLSQIDTLLNTVNSKQTDYGAAQNRLESALDEISTQYENLVSSRSTLRDADIAEVSSEYIKQQILQQASATLLSTANQTPALALQLL